MASPHPLPLGTRVRHYAEQYPEARKGTATILEAQPSGGGDYEYLVKRDQALAPGLPNDPTWWASYMVCPALA